MFPELAKKNYRFISSGGKQGIRFKLLKDAKEADLHFLTLKNIIIQAANHRYQNG